MLETFTAIRTLTFSAKKLGTFPAIMSGTFPSLNVRNLLQSGFRTQNLGAFWLKVGHFSSQNWELIVLKTWELFGSKVGNFFTSKSGERFGSKIRNFFAQKLGTFCTHDIY